MPGKGGGLLLTLRAGDVRGLRIGVTRSLFGDGLDPEVLTACDRSLEQLREAGASLVDVELPHSSHAIAVYYLVAMAEAMKHAVTAGRLAYLAGRIPKKMYASASSPVEGLVGR